MLIAITSPKGGTGKSTLSINLATRFARDGLYTCIADCGDSETCLKWAQTRYHVKENLPEVTVHSAPQGIMVNQLKRLNREFSLLIVDAMAASGDPVAKILNMSHYALIPVRCSGPDIDALSDFMNWVKWIDRDRDIPANTGIVVNQYDPRPTIDQRYHEYVKSHFKTQLFPEVIYQRAAYREAYTLGMGVTEMAELDRKREYQAAADEMEAFYQALLIRLSQTRYGQYEIFERLIKKTSR